MLNYIYILCKKVICNKYACDSHFVLSYYRWMSIDFTHILQNCVIDTRKITVCWAIGIILVSGSPQYDDVIKWKHFPCYWPFVRGIHRSPVNSPHKGQWRGALICFLINAWINGWINNREAGDLRRHHGHYDVSVMKALKLPNTTTTKESKAKRCGYLIRDTVQK